MPKSTPITVKVAGLPEVESALAELAALKAAIRWHRADAAQVLEDISDGTVQADDEGRTRARIEADVWDEVADAMDTIHRKTEDTTMTADMTTKDAHLMCEATDWYDATAPGPEVCPPCREDNHCDGWCSFCECDCAVAVRVAVSSDHLTNGQI